MIRIFILDDHALIRTGYRYLLAKHDDFEVVGEAGRGEEALTAIRLLRPDVVLCDLHMPGMSGLEVTERIIRSGLSSRVLIVSVQEDGPLPKRLLESGAGGYVGKGCAEDELLRALRAVAAGKRYLGGELAQRLALASMSGEPTPFGQLTPRELEVVMMLCQGLRMADIGRRLSLSAKTVATHKYRVFEKLGIDDTVALARLAGQYGLSDPALAMSSQH